MDFIKILLKFLGFLFIYLFCFIQNINSQVREISGTVTNFTNGKPVSKIKISVKGTDIFTETNRKGKYKISFVDTLREIEFSGFPGMKVKEIDIINKNIYNIVLIELSDDEFLNLSLEELMQINVISASLKKEDIDLAPSNITVITKKMIDERGYQTLVEVCEDIPGFDFLIFEDGGGEYPTFNMNRGVGTLGNEKILVMVDGIIQNNISFNWSFLWTYENMFNDIERIEIIEGPGSSIYGAQAYSGVIHFITRSDFDGIEAKVSYGSNFTRVLDLYAGKQFENDINLSFAIHKYDSDGDGGKDRYDPGNYFHNLLYPETILADYDENGNYVENIPNPIGGEKIPDGFNNENNSFSLRSKLKVKNTEIGVFFWNMNRGSGSYLVSYEYNPTLKENQSSSEGYHFYIKNEAKFNDKLSLQSNIIFRGTHILPKTGFRYNYKFPNMTKNYVAYSYQAYIEERLSYNFSEKTDFLFGIKNMISAKTPRVVSLGYFPDNTTHTESSWNIANKGEGINVSENFPIFNVNEIAIYGLWNNKWNKKISTSFGLRYDNSSEYGETINPRASLIIRLSNLFGIKLLYGTAFRQPSISELNSEFRGNKNLTPEKISTYELELNSKIINNKMKLRTNIFYTEMTDFIGKITDNNMPSGERFENKDKSFVRGLSFDLSFLINKNISLFSNYMLMQGKIADTISWKQMERTAQHKINGGININLFENKLNINCRMNYVAKRKAQSTNQWLQKYENGYAPSYKKINLVVTYKFLESFDLQLIVKNLLNEQFYGIARENGSGMIIDYDYQNNPNPDGFIGSYHPQPGRTFLLNLKYIF